MTYLKSAAMEAGSPIQKEHVTRDEMQAQDTLSSLYWWQAINHEQDHPWRRTNNFSETKTDDM